MKVPAMPRIYALDAMNTGQAVVTWLSPVGNRIDECGDLFQTVFRQHGWGGGEGAAE
jgi:uncharacterized protein (DUF1810 family)